MYIRSLFVAALLLAQPVAAQLNTNKQHERSSLTASPHTSAVLQEGPSRVVKGRSVALQQDLQRVAVLVPEAARTRVLRNGFPGLGLGPAALSQHAVAGWIMIQVTQRDAATMERLVRALAEQPDVRFASPVFVDDLGGPMFATPDVLAVFEPGISAGERLSIARGLGLELEKEFGAVGVLLFRHTTARTGYEVLSASNELAMRSGLVAAEPDMVFTGRGDLIPNDPQFPDCWGLRNTGQSGGTVGIDMRAWLAWDITTGSNSIITVVFDTGVEQTHPDINQAPGNDFTTDASNSGDPVNSFDNHGTPVAGCVSATINNALGTVGVAPGTRAASARCMIGINSSGNWDSQASWTVDGLNWASTISARVTNNSNYYGFNSAAIESAYASTRNAGMVHFASSGNDNQNNLGYPSSLPTVNAVGAITRTGARSSFSNYNANLAFVAPGSEVNSTDRTGAAGYSTGDYAVVQGTSFSSPYAAGVAALVLSFRPSMTAMQVEQLLAQTAIDLGTAGFDINFGHGLVNAQAALQALVAGDNVCGAGLLLPGTNGPFSNVGATVEAGEPAPPNTSCTGQGSWCPGPEGVPGNSVWFRFVAPASGRISINFGNTANWDSQIAVWSAPSCSALLSGGATLVAANDDITGDVPYHAAILPVCVIPGQQYYVQVDGYDATTNGAFELVLVEEAVLTWYADADGDGFGAGTPAVNLLTQGFDDLAAALAAGWAQVNRSAPLGAEPWFQGIASLFTANSGAANSYVAVNYASGASVSTLSNWLFTPEVALQNGLQFTFRTRRISSSFPDRLQVRLSTTGASTNVGTTATSVGDFTTLLLDINPTYTQAGYPTVWTLYTVTITGLAGPVNGRLAFRYFVENGGPSGANSDYIGLDDVLLQMPAQGVQVTCVPPPGYVTNNLDDCPTVTGVVGSACNDGNPSTINDVLNASCQCVGTPAAVQVSARVILEGAYDPLAGLMRDNLRTLPGFPIAHPYSGVPFGHSGSETINPAILAVQGNNAIVDWVLVELRDNASPAIILARRAALVQRDGDVVDTDGVSAVQFIGTAPGTYRVALRHRNHLGAMTSSSIGLSGTPVTVDFTQPALATFGTDARKSTVDGKLALWPGNVNPDDQVKYLGAGDDRDPVLGAIGGTVLTTVLNNVYHQADVTMNGEVKYLGAGDDRDPILSTIGGVILNSVRLEQLP